METEESLKILIADDSNSDRMLLKAIVQNQGHEVVVAADGVEAIEVFSRERPDIILLDALMPRMDGFEVAEKIKDITSEEFVPIIFLTSLKEADSLALCLEAGGDDFLTKPYNSVILKAKINAFRRMLKMHNTVQQQRDQIAMNNEHLIQEQEVAKRVFDKVAHAGCLHVHNINYRLSPMAVFNGDVLLAAVRPNGNIAVLLGDFTGHGLAAAIGAMPLAQTFYSMTAKGFGMREILQEVNLKLKDILPVGVFCCAGMIDLSLRDKTVEVWNGGLPDCILYKPDAEQPEERCVRLHSTHLPLGVLNAKDFKNDTSMHEMNDGDCVFLWSDGILEATNAQGEMFGEARIHDVFLDNKKPDMLFQELNDVINQFIGSSGPDDDLSMVEVTMVNQQDFETQNLTQVETNYQGPMDWTFSYEVRPDTLREFNPVPVMLQILMDVPGLRPHSGDIYTVLTELYSNSLEHGVLGLESDLKSSSEGFTEYYKRRADGLRALQDGYVKFALDYTGDDKAGCLKIYVEDSGEGFDYHEYMNVEPEIGSYCGRGVPLLRTLCREITYSGKGNQVDVIFDWSYD